MNTGAQSGYIVLADLTGFDAYIAAVELEHAQEILAGLMEFLVHQLSPPLVFSSIHRDAILAFSEPGSEPSGELLFQLLEAAYRAFRNQLITIERETSCGCQACLTIPRLDLKFIVHYGSYSVSLLGEKRELNGLDTEFVRDRLAKDQVAAGERAYALFTSKAVERMGVQMTDARFGRGVYPDYGEVLTERVDLKARYEASNLISPVFVDPASAMVTLSHDFSVQPQMLWAWLNKPDLRNQWMTGRHWTKKYWADGHPGIGATNHCQHDSGSLIETIRDWRPFQYFTVDMESNFSWMFFRLTYHLEELPNRSGTRLHLLGRIVGPMPGFIGRRMLKMLMDPLQSDLGILEKLAAGA